MEPLPQSLLRPGIGWAAFGGLLLAAILVPFFLFAEPLEAGARHLLESPLPPWQVALLLGGLLAGDIVLPVPSSLVSTAAGGLLGFGGGLVVSWVGLQVSCLVGYVLGARAGRGALRRMVGQVEVERMEWAARHYGHWFLLVLRAVPVLAEASVVLAGVSRMPLRWFLGVSALANLGISATYAALGASSARLESFLLLFGGMVLVPALVLWRVRRALPGPRLDLG